MVGVDEDFVIYEALQLCFTSQEILHVPLEKNTFYCYSKQGGRCPQKQNDHQEL